MEAKRNLVPIRDMIVFTALVAGVGPLLSLFLPQPLAMVGFSIPLLYAWWRGVFPARIFLRICEFVIFSCLLYWACHAGLLGRDWALPLLILAYSLLALRETWERRRRCRSA